MEGQTPGVKKCPYCNSKDTNIKHLGGTGWFISCPDCGLNGPVKEDAWSAAKEFDRMTMEPLENHITVESSIDDLLNFATGVRLSNALKAGYHGKKIKDLIPDMKDGSVYKYRNLGAKTAEDLEAILLHLGLIDSPILPKDNP